MMRAGIEREGATLTPGQPEELFEWSFHHRWDQGQPYHLEPDGRFLTLAREARTGSAISPYDLVVVQNWVEELKRLVPTE